MKKAKQQITIVEGQHNYSGEVPGHGHFEATYAAYREACRLTKPELMVLVIAIYEGTEFGAAHWKGFRKEPLALIVASCHVEIAVPPAVIPETPEPVTIIVTDDEAPVSELVPSQRHRHKVNNGYCSTCLA